MQDQELGQRGAPHAGLHAGESGAAPLTPVAAATRCAMDGASGAVARIAAAWPRLPGHIKAAILALVGGEGA
ncbi:MAG: hypothetical protein HY721_29140 [Planctomycetes bacterium]|nr:hypothetical protein [Planctomycetota bacterium]